MQQVLSNPYRILGLLAGTNAKDRIRQVKRLKQFLEAEQEPEDDFRLPTLGPFKRDLEIVGQADSKLNLDQDKMYAALFWFYNGNAISDEPAFEAIKSGDLDSVINIWSKLTASNEVSKRNASAFNNLSTLYLSGVLEGTNSTEEIIKNGVSLKLKFLESEFFNEFKNQVVDETFTSTKKDLEIYFLNEVASEITKNGTIKTSDFINVISSLEFIAKEDFLKGFVQKPIQQVEQMIAECKSTRKTSKKDVIVAGTKLYNESVPLLKTLAGILGKTNQKFISITDKVADEVLQCGIQLFNEYKESTTYDPGEPAMKLFKLAKGIAQGSIVKERIKENSEGLQEWIDEKPEREKQDRVKADLQSLMKIFEDFEDRDETISNASLLISRCKPHLRVFKDTFGAFDDLYLKLSTRVAMQTQSYIISEVNEAQSNLEHKIAINRYGTIASLKNTLTKAWHATVEVGALDLESDFENNSHKKNKEALRNLCRQLNAGPYESSATSSSTSSYSNSTSSSSNGEFDFSANAWWIVAIIGIIIGAAAGGGGAVAGGIIGLIIGANITK